MMPIFTLFAALHWVWWPPLALNLRQAAHLTTTKRLLGNPLWTRYTLIEHNRLHCWCPLTQPRVESVAILFNIHPPQQHRERAREEKQARIILRILSGQFYSNYRLILITICIITSPREIPHNWLLEEVLSPFFPSFHRLLQGETFYFFFFLIFPHDTCYFPMSQQKKSLNPHFRGEYEGREKSLKRILVCIMKAKTKNLWKICKYFKSF